MLPALRTALPLAIGLLASPTLAQNRLTSPQQFFGHEIGADYVLADYRQLADYWRQLDGQSDRMQVVSIGETTEGRPQLMAILTSAGNARDLDRYRDIARRLALAEGVSEEQARALAREGKAVVWIDGGLHATEVLGAQQLIETVWQLVSRNDAETLRILDDVIVLVVQANPDGMELVSDWYMREPDPLKRNSDDIPRLYHAYIGHDNNRDFYLSSQRETTNMNRVLYREWFPQILYNHHQTGPAGAIMFAPPFRDPFNYLLHPLIVTGLDLVGAAMHNRFVAEKKPGVTMREGAGYSTWWNGGLRTTAYFHNVIGLLTESKGNPTPVDIPLIPFLQQPTAQMPFPIAPQAKWHFRQSVEYEVTANYAVLDMASRYRETFLYNIWRMGADEIARGSADTWTDYPRRIARLRQAMEQAQPPATTGPRGICDRVREGMPVERQRPCMSGEQATSFFRLLRAPELRDPRGYIIPSDQPDFATATRFIHALQKTGVSVLRATAPFQVAGRDYPTGSWVVMAAQAYRPHVLDLFEPQDHPDDFEYPGGPPIHPYDAAGWTLALQMGVRFDRILDGFTGPFEKLTDLAAIPPGVVAAGRAAGWILAPAANDAFRAASRILGARGEVHRLNRAWESGGIAHAAGSFWIPARSALRPGIEALARDFGLRFHAAAAAPPRDALVRLRQPRVGIVDVWGGSMPAGWTRWILEQFEIPFEVVFAKTLDAGDLRRRFDVLVLVDAVVPERDAPVSLPDSAGIPIEYRERLGQVTVGRTVPRLREFLEAGGSIITIGTSTVLAKHLGLPIRDHLVERAADGSVRPLPGEKYFIPASILRVRLEESNPLAWGMGPEADVMFDNSPVFTFDGAAPGIERVAWFDRPEPLRSGWAWGQPHLQNGIAAARATVGTGSLFLFGPEILYRGQPHGTFRLFFNALYRPVPVSR